MDLLKVIINYFQYLIGLLTFLYFMVIGNAPRLPYDIYCLEELDSKYNNVLTFSFLFLCVILFLKIYLDYKKSINTSILVGLLLFVIPIAHYLICSYIESIFPCVS